ncbi:DUF1446-domain-containing protein [Sodiomyces alkalinus F11]|uniref:DUF1446-domain-containing protein n=1 Tax=Sodiomyces alkalinus (strain CBS 110278 / VKM F-3762 / F11) TaxID=1314773 RepID=A0A3N2PU30_SODAK|nr:DUF1446-domain-containing protein [Sodiomyces alkalinus F11]ROT38013.1 DUF1446-domain-containing protein [Sodiomyces alkalinus F11]
MPRRPIRIGTFSAALNNKSDQLHRLVKEGNVDAIAIAYLTKSTLASKATQLQTRPDLGYDPNFLEQLAWNNGATAHLIAQTRIKIVHDGGALNPRRLAEKADAYFKSLGIQNVNVAWVEGDNVTDQVRSGGFPADRPGLELSPSSHSRVLLANVCTGQAGIVRALEAGADVVVCGRCADASSVLGLASWWQGWDARDHDRLAGVAMAGRLIESQPYGRRLTGGNHVAHMQGTVPELGFPVVEIGHDGDVVVTKVGGSRGVVTVDSCKARLLSEIRGPFYVNPDVVADNRRAKLEQIDRDRVRLSGVKGLPPSPRVEVPLRVQFTGGQVVDVPAKEARDCAEVPARPDYEPRRAATYGMLGRIFPPGTIRRPLGHLALATATAGGMGGNDIDASVGLWVGDERAWEWLRGIMSSARLRELLGDGWDERFAVERCEFPNLWAVHFVIRESGQNGANKSSSQLTGFEQRVSEMLRGRVVEMPAELVQAEVRRRKAMANAGRSNL